MPCRVRYVPSCVTEEVDNAQELMQSSLEQFSATVYGSYSTVDFRKRSQRNQKIG